MIRRDDGREKTGCIEKRKSHDEGRGPGARREGIILDELRGQDVWREGRRQDEGKGRDVDRKVRGQDICTDFLMCLWWGKRSLLKTKLNVRIILFLLEEKCLNNSCVSLNI